MLAIGFVQVHRSVPEGTAPLDDARVVVRMRDGDRRHTAERGDRRDKLVVDERDAVPEDVAAWGLDEECPLPDREARLAADPGQARLLLADLGAVPGAELRERRPALALPAHVLALVVADRATRRRLLALGVLDAA